MNARFCTFSCALLACWSVTVSLAQLPGPATLGDLLDGSSRRPLRVPAEASSGPRLPVPAAAEIEEARDLIRQAYEDDLKAAAKNPEPLIQKLLAAAGQTKDAARRYALLLEAEEAAALGGDPGRATELIDIRTTEFEEDGIQLRIDRLAEFLTPKAKTDPEVLVGLYEQAVETAERGMEDDSLEQAEAAAEMAASIARSLFLAGNARKNDAVSEDGESKQSQARTLVKDIQRRAVLFAEYQRALEALKAQDDPAAHGVVGRYLCFEAGDWEKGLPFLAKGDQPETAEIAAKELTVLAVNKPDAKDLFELAGTWWQAAKAKDGSEASSAAAVRRHAGRLYESILERLDDPLDRALAQKRLNDAPDGRDAVRSRRSLPKQGPRTRPAKEIDLLATVDVARDAVMGRWVKQEDGGVRFDRHGSPNGKLEIPYRPAIAEYDLLAQVDVLGGARHVVFFVVLENQTRFFIIKPFAVENLPSVPGAACELAEDRTHQIVVQVRREGVRVVVDGQRVAEGPPGSMRDNGYWNLRQNGVFGIGSHESVLLFRSVRLQPPKRGEAD